MQSSDYKFKIIFCVAIIAALSYIAVRERYIGELKAESVRNQNNAEALLEDVERYRVLDSLSGARVQSLELSLREFERYRAEDARIIERLKARNRDLTEMANAQTQTVIEMRTTVRDTVIVRDSARVEAMAVSCGDPWYDFRGLIAGGVFSGKLACRDSLLVAETVRRKRFLGILWKTGKIKDRRLDVVSRNPHTEIKSVEHVVIEK